MEESILLTLFGNRAVSQVPSSKAPKSPPAPPTTAAMAASFVGSMAEWAKGGFQVVPAATHQVRLAACQECSYHEAPRCTLCGCFTDKKAWLPHEDCPLGKWPS